jgi:hypothetical protein
MSQMDDLTLFRIYDHILEQDLMEQLASGDSNQIAAAEKYIAERIYDQVSQGEIEDVVQDYLSYRSVDEQLALIRKFTISEPSAWERFFRWLRGV